MTIRQDKAIDPLALEGVEPGMFDPLVFMGGERIFATAFEAT